MTLWDFADRHWVIAGLVVWFVGIGFLNLTSGVRRAAKGARDASRS